MVRAREPETIAEVKNKIYEQEGIPPDPQKLISASRHLVDARTLKDYDIQTGATLHLITPQDKSCST